MSKKKDYPSPSPCSSSSVRAPPNLPGGTADYGWGSTGCPFAVDDIPRSYEARGVEHTPKYGTAGHGGAREFVAHGDGQDDDAKVSKASVPFTTWVNMHVRRILATKTKFSFYLLKSISNCRGRRSAASTALFPIPVPFDGLWMQGPLKCNKRMRCEIARRKLLHLAVMALNFMHSTAPLASIELLWRRPSSLHLGVYRRLATLIKACDHVDHVSVRGVGRKNAKLGARFNEVLKSLQSWGQGLKTGYDAGLDGMAVPLENDEEELVPYRQLDASRLKLTGRGLWDCSEWLDEVLIMPYLEPEVLAHGGQPAEGTYPDVRREDPKEVFELMRRWDQQGLLRLIPEKEAPDELFKYVRVFNNYKSVEVDRMIIDRRGQNFSEAVLHGPSSNLPSGVALLQIAPLMWEEVVAGCITDRKDFYHQFWSSPKRAATNCLFPGFRLSSLRGFAAYRAFEEEFMKKIPKGKKVRTDVGDGLGGESGGGVVDGDPLVFGCFASIGQGDHLGVELATSAHGGLLSSEGLLQPSSRLLARSAVAHDVCNEGLVIDDYFAVSRESRLAFEFGKEGLCSGPHDKDHPEVQTKALRCLSRAKQIYLREGILGSDDKDQINRLLFKAAGAEIDSRLQTVRDGAVLVGAPVAKRLGLASLTAVAASLGYTSDVLHSSLVGSWISVLLFRRPMMAVLDEVFRVCSTSMMDPENPSLVRMPRAAAEEFALLACLAPVLTSNVAIPFSKKVYATDASNDKGAIVSSEIDEDISKLLWRSADKKGENLPLLTAAQVVRKSYDASFEELLREEEFPQVPFEDDADPEPVRRPLALYYDFIEICGGAGKVADALVGKGVVVGPVLDLARSPAYDIRDHKLIRWVLHLLEEGRLLSYLVAPPCTTFSPAAFPYVRTYKEPRGLLPLSEKAIVGNALAFAALCFLNASTRLNVMGAGEQSRRSKMRWLKEWEHLLDCGAEETWLASCAYGSPHKKEFVFISVNMDLGGLHRRCSGDHKHIVIQGSYTKPSATYTDQLAAALGQAFYDHIVRRKQLYQEVDIEVAGLEDPLSNDLCLSSSWKVDAAWDWKGRSHINLLETAAVLHLFRQKAREGGDERFVFLEDSHVSRSALARGRTSSNALRPMLRKAGALTTAYGLYPAGRFAPTRMNPADAPTRSRAIEDAQPLSICGCLGSLGRHWISSKPRLKRWASNWVRITILLIPAYFDSRWEEGWRTHRSVWTIPSEQLPLPSRFDSTLGFPGEGPSACFALLGFCYLPFAVTPPSLLIWILVNCPLSCQGARGVPSNPFDLSHGDAVRQRARDGIELGAGRRITEATALSRNALVENFKHWLAKNGLGFELFLESPPDLDRINAVLTDFGRFLFKAGKPYYHYAESINGLVTVRPTLRRSLQQAWDLAFLWGSYEPSEHHIAVPHQVLLSIITVCLIWGWTREAAIFALAFGALLRIGEIMSATRADLILPQDVDYSIPHVLLKVNEPKTRFRAARHQAGKCESPDLILVATLGFAGLGRSEKLWPMSSTTLRNRLTKVLERLHLPSTPTSTPKAISLASFRPGGATWLITMTESAELVQRRGRWASWATMSIYLQEVAASTYLNDVSCTAKQLVLSGMRLFTEVLAKARTLKSSQVPETVWPFVFGSNHP